MNPVSPVIPDENWREIKIAEHQDEYVTVPVIPLNNEGTLLSRWELADEEIETIIKTRSIYFYQWTCGGPMQPVSLTTERPQLRELNESDHRLR